MKIKSTTINTIFWDWNGTLINDIDVCVKCINKLLLKRKLPVITKKYYQEIFTFPVKEYYRILGFDFKNDEFEDLAVEFIELYTKAISESVLHYAATEVLDEFKKKSYKQYIISAMEHQQLLKSVENLRVEHYFSHISGIGDIYANDKLNNARKLIKICGKEPKNICLIGDTLHDLEVAKAIGVQCVLVANGHQSEEKLKKSGAVVIKNLLQLL